MDFQTTPVTPHAVAPATSLNLGILSLSTAPPKTVRKFAHSFRLKAVATFKQPARLCSGRDKRLLPRAQLQYGPGRGKYFVTEVGSEGLRSTV